MGSVVQRSPTLGRDGGGDGDDDEFEDSLELV